MDLSIFVVFCVVSFSGTMFIQNKTMSTDAELYGQVVVEILDV